MATARAENKPLRLLSANELDKILKDHMLWLYTSGKKGFCADLRGAILAGTNLRGVNLMGANLEHAHLVGVNLEGANLEGAHLVGVNLYGANLERAILQDVNLEGANIEGANIEGAELRGTSLEGANLINANLDGADLGGANLDGAGVSAPWKILDGKLVREDGTTQEDGTGNHRTICAGVSVVAVLLAVNDPGNPKADCDD